MDAKVTVGIHGPSMDPIHKVTPVSWYPWTIHVSYPQRYPVSQYLWMPKLLWSMDPIQNGIPSVTVSMNAKVTVGIHGPSMDPILYDNPFVTVSMDAKVTIFPIFIVPR